MKESGTIWKKCTAKRTLTDYSTDPPSVKEWIESESTYDQGKDVMISKEYDELGRIKNEIIYYETEMHLIDYDESGRKITENTIRYAENEFGDSTISSVDENGNIKDEKLEYDESGRVNKKIFIENDREDSYLEFEYDNKDRVVLTRSFEKGKLEFYEEDIYVSENESMSFRYNESGQLTLKTEYKNLPDRNIFINSYFDEDGILLRRSEEDRNSNDQVLEQRHYDSNDNLTYHIIFGEDDEFGFRKELKENKFINNKLREQIDTKYNYDY